jgi:PAS domain S-box-containing protein
MIVTLDAGLTMLSVNPACATQLGFTIGDLEGRSVLSLFHEYDRTLVAAQLHDCLRSPHQVHRWQFRKVHRDGTILWVEETAQAVYDLNGTLNILVVCQDITERKRSEEAIRLLNNELADRAAELESANRELEAFNYTIAHDLRRPLTNINGYCQILREICYRNLDESCREYLDEIYQGTLRMNQLIDTLLNFSRLAAVELHRERIDLSALAQEVAAELKLSEPDRRVTFRIDDGIWVTGDAKLLRVVLANLLGNAWKYTGHREEALIEFGRTTTDGEPECYVRDNGSGFAMADAGKIFHPFHRLHCDKEFKGFGIGLATVERIIRRHGGTIRAEGEPGRGATFRFTLGTEGGSRTD